MKKILLFSISAFILVLLTAFILVVIFYNPEKPVKIRAKDVNTAVKKAEVQRLLNSAFAISSRQTSVLGAKVPLRVKKDGPKRTADYSFNAIAPSWQEQTPKGSKVSIQIRTSKDGNNWSNWKNVKIDEDGNEKDGVETNVIYGGLIVAEGKYFQERLIFETTSPDKIPEVKNLKLTYIDSKEKDNLLEKILKVIKIKAKEVFAATSVPERPTDNPNVCSRSCWGADPSLMKWNPYKYPVKKAVIHHTVTANYDPNPKATIRAIYYYHAVTRGWGDIGYNFLVDSNGNIYEGRYGGDGVAGAHALGYNVGSVGVGVLGDFRYISPNKKVRNALHKIAVWKFYTHNVDPDKVTKFGNPLKRLPSVFYHGQVSNTACAGTYLNNFTPSLKKLAHYMPQQILLKNSSGINRIVGSSSQTVSDLLAAYKNKGVVAPNYIRKISAFPDDGITPPNDTNYSSQWDLPKLDALNVWKESTGGSSSIKVAVVDTGVAYEDYNPPGSENYTKGPDFASTNFVAGYDYVNNDAHPNDDDGHGTVVASMIAESTNNSIGSASLAYNVSIMPIKVCDSDGWCLDSEVAKGIKFARMNGAKVINMSIGGDDYSSVVQSTINLAWDFGIVTVASSGNDGINKLSYPARGFRVLGVGALTSSDSRASYSNYGYRLDLVAPGGNGLGGSGDLLYQYVNCTVGLDCTSFEYARVAGTSMSSPLVSAAAALIFSKDADIGNAEAVDALIKNAQDLGPSGYDSQFGYGRIKPYNAILNVAPPTKPFGVMKNDSRDYNFFVFNVPNDTEPRGPIGADFWNLPGGNNTVAAAEIKVNGVSKVGVVKNETGDYNFYLYNFPSGFAAATKIGADYWNIPAGNNVVSIAGVDIDGDGTDEVAVMKNEKGDYNLYVYRAPNGTEGTDLVGIDKWTIPSGNNTRAIGGLGDIDGDGKGELGVIKNTRGDYNFFAYDPPVGTQAKEIIAADYWNIPAQNNVVDIDGIGDINSDGQRDLAVMKNKKGDYNFYIYTIPSGIEGVARIAADYWEIPAKNNSLFVVGNK